MYKWKMKLKNDVRHLRGENKTLVCNTDNAECLFLSNECLEIIEQAIDEKLSFDELFASIEDEESKVYMKQVVDKMEQLKMWSYDDNERITFKSIKVSIDITNKCNLSCKHCCVRAGEEERGKDLSTDEMMDIVKKVVNANPIGITISGGEPLIRKDFVDIVKEIKKSYNGILSLMTNATLIDEDMAKFINKHFFAVDVSIDGADEESCSILRGKGTFEKCINGIKELKKAGMNRITASMVETKENTYSKIAFHKLCEELEIKSIIRKLDECGRAENIYSYSCLNSNGEINAKKMEDNFVNKRLYKMKPQIFACQGAKREFQIDYRGNILPCGAVMDEIFCMGNMCEIENFKDYIESGNYKATTGYKEFADMKPYNFKMCKDCNKNLLCFSCANETRRLANNKACEKICSENKCYFDLYWREYEGI